MYTASTELIGPALRDNEDKEGKEVGAMANDKSYLVANMSPVFIYPPLYTDKPASG